MDPRELQYIARKMNRQLDLGKGLGLSADQLAMLAVIGVNDLVQQKAAEALKEQARLRHMRGQVAVARSVPTMAPVSMILSPSPAQGEPWPDEIDVHHRSVPKSHRAGPVDPQEEFERVQQRFRKPSAAPVTGDAATDAYSRAREMLSAPRRGPSGKGKGPSGRR